MNAPIRVIPTGRPLPDDGPAELLVDVDTTTPGEVYLDDGLGLRFDGSVLHVDGPDRDLLVSADGRPVTRLRAGSATVDLSAAIEIRMGGGAWSRDLAELDAAVQADATTGVRHRYDTTPAAPGAGAAAVVRVHASTDVRHVRVEVTEPIRATVDATRAEDGRWEAELAPCGETSVVRYEVEAVRTDGSTFRVDDAGADFAFARPNLTFHRPPRSTFSYVAAPPPPPDWLVDGVGYHVLVDRFAGAGGERVDDARATSLLGFAGGTITGLTARLDHVAALGATVLLVSPLTPGEMHVCYDVKDHFDVEPRFGDLDDVRALLARAHGLGLRVVLDIEVSYLGMRHPRATDPSWVLHGPDRRPLGWYGGNPTFVPVDHFHPDARAHLLEALRWWLRLGFDGFRFDSAHAAPFDFWSDVAIAVATEKPDAATIVEATRPIDHCRRYEGRVSGFLDFDAQRALRGCCGDGSVVPSQLAAAFEQQAALPSGLAAVAFFECHDGPRFGLVAGGDRRRTELATALLLASPAVPLLYYGTEVGMTQEEPGEMDILARKPMPWAGHDIRLQSTTRQLVARRRGSVALRRGTYRTVQADDAAGVLVFERLDAASGGRVLVSANTTDRPHRGLGLAPFEVRFEEGS